MTRICWLIGHKFIGSRYYTDKNGDERYQKFQINFCSRCGLSKDDIYGSRDCDCCCENGDLPSDKDDPGGSLTY